MDMVDLAHKTRSDFGRGTYELSVVANVLPVFVIALESAICLGICRSKRRLQRRMIKMNYLPLCFRMMFSRFRSSFWGKEKKKSGLFGFLFKRFGDEPHYRWGHD